MATPGVTQPLRLEQAIYTSMARDGKSGYHLVSRSRGLTEREARALTSWCPSQGALIVDEANRASVNFHPLSPGSYALSRTFEGGSEYSGRGGRQIYTHALILRENQLNALGCPPLAIYFDAMALGHFRYRADPESLLDPVEVGLCHRVADHKACLARLQSLGAGDASKICQKLFDGQSVQVRFPGDRLALAECLLGLLPGDAGRMISFSTSLTASLSRPFRLVVLG